MLKKRLLHLIIDQLIDRLTPEMLRSIVDYLLDQAEDLIASTETQADDRFLMPIISMAREVFHVPDNDAPGNDDDTDAFVG
jgi:hypothetical protein